MALERKAKAREHKYLDWIRSQECCVCGGESEAHHVKIKGLHLGGMGMKGPHLFSIPLCHTHHMSFHRDPKEWENLHGTQTFYLLKTLAVAEMAGLIRY